MSSFAGSGQTESSHLLSQVIDKASIVRNQLTKRLVAFFQIHLGSDAIEKLHVANGLFRAATSEFGIRIFRLIGEFDSNSGLLERGFFCILAHRNQSDRRYAAKLGDTTTLPIMKLHSRRESARPCFRIAHCIVRLLGSWSQVSQFFLTLDMCV